MKKVYGYIYLIRNTVNGKVYVGLTTKDFDSRYRKNLLTTHNPHLKASILKYGEDKFEVIKDLAVAYSKEELDELEKHYIKEFDSMNPEKGYNKTEGGHSGKWSEEAKKKQSERNRGEGNPRYGVHLDEETKRKISLSVTKSITGKGNPMYGKKHTEETKRLMSEKRKKRVKCNTGETFDSIMEATEWCGLKDASSIGRCCRGRVKSAGKHPVTGEKLVWEFVDQ